MKRLILLMLVSIGHYQRLSSLKERSIKFDTDPPQHLDARFRLFKTDNLWNFILPDTRLGLLYQVQYSVDNKKGSRGIFPLNDEPLVDPKDAKDARFTFYRTKNHNKINFHSNPARKETENHEPRTITNS